MKGRNYSVQELGNGKERRKNESRTLSLYIRQSGTRDIWHTAILPWPNRMFAQGCDRCLWSTLQPQQKRNSSFSLGCKEEGEPLEKFTVDQTILTSTCNFGTLRESLVRDRIIRGIHDSKLREDLLKVADLALDKYSCYRRPFAR